VVVEHDDHTLDAWDQILRLVPRVADLIDVILSLGLLVDEQDQTPADAWIERYWRLVNELIGIRQGIDVAALKRDYGPGAPPIPRYDDKLDDEIEVAQQELDWLLPVLEEITTTVDVVQRCVRENRRGDAAEVIGELIGVTDLEGSRCSFGELFRLWGRKSRADRFQQLPGIMCGSCSSTCSSSPTCSVHCFAVDAPCLPRTCSSASSSPR
jgi:hypothetical protein